MFALFAKAFCNSLFCCFCRLLFIFAMLNPCIYVSPGGAIGDAQWRLLLAVSHCVFLSEVFGSITQHTIIFHSMPTLFSTLYQPNCLQPTNSYWPRKTIKNGHPRIDGHVDATKHFPKSRWLIGCTISHAMTDDRIFFETHDFYHIFRKNNAGNSC